jgi:hypothetical protein
MSGTVRPVYLNPGSQAEALGAALTGLGFTVEVLRRDGHHQHPCVVVNSGPARVVYRTEYVYAAPDDDGDWWFWQPSASDPVAMERIAPVSDVSVTADHVDRTLTRARILGRQAS